TLEEGLTVEEYLNMDNEEQTYWQGAQTPEYISEDPFEIFAAPDTPQASTSAVPLLSYDSYGAMTPEYVPDTDYILEPRPSTPPTVDDAPMDPPEEEMSNVTSNADSTPQSWARPVPGEPPAPSTLVLGREIDEESDHEGGITSEQLSEVQKGKRRARYDSSDEESQAGQNKRSKRRVHRSAAERFLDLEAEATDEEEDEEEDEDMGTFIAPESGLQEDHEDDMGYEGHWIDTQYQSLAEQLAAEAKSAEQMAASIESRHYKRSYATSSDFNAMKYQFSSGSAENPKQENAVVTFLRGCCRLQPSLHVRTYVRRIGDGYVYLDTDTPDKIGKLLRDCVVVNKVHTAPNGIKMTRIDSYTTQPSDNHQANTRSFQELIGLNPPLPSERQPGNWFQMNTRKIKRPNKLDKDDPASQQIKEYSADQVDAENLDDFECYHGDAAFLIETSEEEAIVVLALRVPTSEVLDRYLIVSYPGKNVQIAHSPLILSPEYLTMWRKARCVAIHGLRQITISWKKLLPLKRPLTLREGQIFLASEYPNLENHFLRVQCWNFEVGDDVESWTGLRGDVVRIESDGLYIQTLEDNMGHLRFIGWAARKVWKVGALVRHVVHGWSGFVVFVVENNVVIHSTVEQETRHGSTVIRSRFIQEFLADNSLLCRESSVPALYVEQKSSGVNPASQKISLDHPQPRPASELRIASTGRAPWIDWEILVFDKDHGHGHARVIDVQHGQNTKSGLRIIAQWTTMGKTMDYFPVDYDKILHLEYVFGLRFSFVISY
ncbi:hypothetical protein MPER_13163, partial [Moniliophthora perniciosa FA553]